MSIQETVDAIRNFLVAGSRAPVQGMVDHSEEYARACIEANDRLRKCGDALRRDLRGDAIQLAEAEPNLLDVIALLDFPELHSWKDLCVLTPELTTPPDILIETATALNEAYAAEQPVQNLMAHHRLLALARAPLSERIMVMRRLADSDPSSSFWDDDIRSFERARIEEARQQVTLAAKAGDSRAVTRINTEFNDSKWRISVPADFKRLLQATTTRLHTDRTVVELRQMLPTLNDAYGAMEYENAKQLLGQFFATTASAKIQLPPDLHEQIDPIQSWVNEESSRKQKQIDFDSACGSLQQALDTDQATPSIQRAYEATLQFHLELPEHLDQRYRQCIATRAVAIRHRRRLMWVSVAAGFVLIGSGIAVFAYQSMLSTEIKESQNAIAVAASEVQLGNLDKGRGLRDELVAEHPRILKSPLITKALLDFDGTVATEKQREGDFQQHLKATVDAGVEKPAEADLQQATSLAKTSAETIALEQFKSRLAQYRGKKQQEIDRAFSSDGTSLASDLDQKLTLELLAINADQYDQQLHNLAKRVDDLRNVSSVSPGLKQAQLASLDAMVERRKEDLNSSQKRQQALRGVRAFGSSADAHAAALKQFVQVCSDDPRCPEFQRAAANLPATQAVEVWTKLVERWSNSLLPANYDAAKDRSAEVKHYLEQYPNTPLADAVQAYQRYLDTGLEIASADGAWKGKFKKLLGNPVVSSLRCLDTSEGSRYYVTGTEKVDVKELAGALKSQSFHAVTSPDLSRTTQVVLREQFLKSTTPVRSPQTLFSEYANNRIDSFEYRDWETVGFDLLGDLQNRSDMNPILRGILIQHVLQLNQPANVWNGNEGLAKVADALIDQNVEDIEWLDPTHKTDPEVLARVDSALKKLPSITTIRTSAVQRREAVLRAVKIAVLGESILLKNGTTSAEIVGTTPSDVGQIAAAVGSDAHLVVVGTSGNGGKWLLDSAGLLKVPDGALVFVLKANKQ